MNKLSSIIGGWTDQIRDNFSPKVESLKDHMGQRFDNDPKFLLKQTQVSMMDFPANYRSVGSQLGSIIMKASESKKQIISDLEQIRDVDYIDTILRDVGGEVLTRGYDQQTEGEFFKFVMKKDDEESKELQVRVNNDLVDLKLYDLLMEYIDDYLFYGQFVFNYDHITNELDDTLNQLTTIPAFKKTELSRVYDESESKLVHHSHYLVLNLFSYRHRLKVRSNDTDEIYNLKIPRGIIPHSIIKKIKDLKLLEALQPILEMQAIDEKMYFYIKFPAGKDAKEAYVEARNYEKLLKSMISVDLSGNSDNLDNVIDKITSVKVIPQFGHQDDLRPQTFNKTNKIDLSQIEDMRKSISNALKIDITGENRDKETEYFKLIKKIRNHLRMSVSEFVKSMVLNRYGVSLGDRDFDLLVPEVQGANELDTLDFTKLKRDAIKDDMTAIVETVDEVQKLIKNPLIKREAILEFYKSKMATISLSGIFIDTDDLDEAINKMPSDEE